jgi:hypothetical protein
MQDGRCGGRKLKEDGGEEQKGSRQTTTIPFTRRLSVLTSNHHEPHFCALSDSVTRQLPNTRGAGMARSLLHTFSDSKHFEDRRGKGYAQPITERINVCTRLILDHSFAQSLYSLFSLIHGLSFHITFRRVLASTIMG